MNTQTILVVDDDAEIREGIRILLTGENYTILEAESGAQALERLSEAVDLVILDVMMPGFSGLRVCEEIRKRSTVPILFLTALAQDSDKLVGLTAGGDDYLTKPFSYSELIARVKALLRRYCVYRGKGQTEVFNQDNTLTAHGVKLSLESSQVWVEGQEVDLTDIEYRILRLLMETPQKVFSIQNIYESIWNEDAIGADNTVAVHIRHIREKIEINAKEPRYLKVVWGIGYKVEKL